jgi:hypothetical protein
VSVNSVFVKALAQALTEFPKLNYFSFWGRPVWGGDNTRISLVHEIGDEGAINLATIADAEEKTLATIHGELKNPVSEALQGPPKQTPWHKVMNFCPWLAFRLMKMTGKFQRDYARDFSPIIFSNINLPAITEAFSSGIGFVAMIVTPGHIQEGKCVFNISIKHEITNARPVGKYLTRVKEIIEAYV